ncbi:Swi3 domain-containing protein [Diaporthe amygdali]|uniref:Swi3 domain-containing protein n=1 Tax=Phomopsis amygdali TaxID=1214568 RepID=UPI0022FE03AF|nr:Swi3 domain-containing protein [Diaporthe amygdali]KAJ0123771.1 Swi3 domain-containing protein [Diaporthe amygdali]
MPSKTDPRNAEPAASNFDDLDNYFLEGDVDDDPFASPKPEDNPKSNKRKEPGDGLGIDEEVSVAKKARVPRIKLDQDRLLSEKGIPALRKRAGKLRLKGKGHEWGDASRLLSFYQEWLDDLFPKAKFLDALAMVEKAGHNKMLQKMRVDWINEGRPKSTVTADGGDDDEPADEQQESEAPAPRQADRIAPIFETSTSGTRPSTPPVEDLFRDDIYGATPIGARRSGKPMETGDEPDQDELDALMAEAEQEPSVPVRPNGGPTKSIFGDGKPKAAEKPRPAEPEDDDLDALMAEAEAERGPRRPPGADASSAKAVPPDFNDDEEAMAEMDGLW